ncbi:CRISPR-associated protein Csx18 [Gloeomargarita lithophora]|uniref:CRISPR-associated protein Csx18 n=1 Tax=Gloeomargarita lithophora TaxID=1188228 RepID=UPI0008F8C65D|nr:CRISPR-associated protein Csx18 [Gloeomargarita lithophora]
MRRNRWLFRRVRNLLAALVNGGVTLTVLLIAPLGLAAVITNTILVMVCTFFGEEVTDFFVGMLRQSITGELLPDERETRITRTRDRE